MIAAIRVRFTPTPASAVWSDAQFGAWLNTTIPFSLAHYWLKSSFGLADLQFQIFPPIVIDDPRLGVPPQFANDGAKMREYLVNGVTAKVTEQFNPNWSVMTGIVIWFAQQTDLFGGGAYYVLAGNGYKALPVCVSDNASRFDAVCQELGHAYGLNHPLDWTAAEYGDPYDSMSSMWYGGTFDPSFDRPANPAFPVVMSGGKDQNAIAGPHLSAAQLSISQFAPALRSAGMFVDVPPSYATGAYSFTLYALDEAIDRFPAQHLPIVAIIPPSTLGSDPYFLELRRPKAYDAGLRTTSAATSRPQFGIVIHSHDKVKNRIVYRDVLPLIDHRGDRDYHMFGGAAFTFRITSIGTDFRSVGIVIGGQNFWKNFGVDISQVTHEVLSTSESEPEVAHLSPCFMFPPGDYTYHYQRKSNRHTLIVTSFGYEQPGYIWKVNDVILDPSKNVVSLPAFVETPVPTGKATTANISVPVNYGVGEDRLALWCNPALGNFTLTVEVKAVETSPSVLKNYYEDRTVVTNVRFDNIEVVWDQAYQDAVKACDEMIDNLNRKRTPRQRFGIPDPGDPLRIRAFEEVFNEVVTAGIDATIAVANAVLDSVTRVANVVRDQLSRRR